MFKDSPEGQTHCFIKCESCLAHYPDTDKHTCDSLMKEMKEKYDKMYIQYCSRCIQITNHQYGVCQKHKKLDKEKEDAEIQADYMKKNNLNY